MEVTTGHTVCTLAHLPTRLTQYCFCATQSALSPTFLHDIRVPTPPPPPTTVYGVVFCTEKGCSTEYGVCTELGYGAMHCA
eukprot:1718664-Rhodomonas_salina.1